MNIQITNGRVVDPASGTDQKADIAIADGKIAGIGSSIPAGFQAERTIDASGMLSDIHGSAAYRANLVKVMAKRAVAAAG